jgi:hypothetical protein
MCGRGVEARTPLSGEVRLASVGHHSLPTLQSLDDSPAFATSACRWRERPACQPNATQGHSSVAVAGAHPLAGRVICASGWHQARVSE